MSTPAPSLLLFTTSHTSLPVRYPHPRKPALLLPGLIHRALHTALDTSPPSFALTPSGSLAIPHPGALARPAPLPVANGDAAPDAEQDDTEVTVKLHLVAAASAQERAEWVRASLGMLAEHKGLGAPDNLLLGFRGVDYRGAKTAATEMFGCGSEGLEAPNTASLDAALESEVLAVWEEVFRAEGLVKPEGKLGSLYAPLGLLEKLVEREGGRVRVNALDTPDCHHLPKDYTGYAREHGVALWAGGGGEGSDPLPAEHLQNILQEFIPVLGQAAPELAGKLEKLDKQIPVRADGLKFEEGQAGVEVRWVLSYTVLSRPRNVVEDKGYIVAADFKA
ncbi:hypothetical protein IAT38_007879 [Cryptococcus sp. DSM 104549]